MNELEKNVYLQAKFIHDLTWEKLPEKVRKRASWIVLDSMGCIWKGLDGKKVPKDTDDAIIEITRAMVSTELYEGNRMAIGHPACHILPYMLVQFQNCTVEKFLCAFVAAYETAARWGRSVRFKNNILGHGTVMTTGVAAAMAILHDLSVQETYDLLLLSASLPEVSVWQTVYQGSALHDIYAGCSAIETRHLLPLLKSGVKSNGAIITDVYKGIMNASIYPELLAEKLEQDYLICQNYFKVHTGCRFIHPFADVLKKQLEDGLEKEKISSINIYTYKKASQISAESVPNELAAKFSTPVSIAVLLEKGELSPDSIRNCQKDQAVAQWKGKIHLYEDEKYNKILPDQRGGRVEINFSDGHSRVMEVFHAVGDFDNPQPYTLKDLTIKFQRNVEAQVDEKEIQVLEKNVLEEPENHILNQSIRLFYEKVGI